MYAAHEDLLLSTENTQGQFNIFSTSIPFYTMFQSGTTYREELTTKWLQAVRAAHMAAACSLTGADAALASECSALY